MPTRSPTRGGPYSVQSCWPRCPRAWAGSAFAPSRRASAPCAFCTSWRSLSLNELVSAMNESSATNARSPLIAVVLSLFATGLGHVYCGRIVTGLVLFLASLLLAPVAVGAALAGLSLFVMLCLALAILAVIGAYLYSVIGSYRLARRLQGAYELRDYNRPGVYALFILVAVTYPALAVLQLRANV